MLACLTSINGLKINNPTPAIKLLFSSSQNTIINCLTNMLYFLH